MNLKAVKGDYIDIHTHNTESTADIFSLLNVFLSDYPELPANKPISVGLHPWHIDTESSALAEKILRKAASLVNVAALGETGLDKSIKTDPDIQERVFRLHAEIAEQQKKPLIIHCVKAFQEIIRLKKDINPTIAWIIHGFRGSEDLASELIRHGFWISLNQWIIRNPEKGRAILGKIPPEKLFLETDEYPDNIADIYRFVEEIWNKDSKSLIFNNYINAFNYTE